MFSLLYAKLIRRAYMTTAYTGMTSLRFTGFGDVGSYEVSAVVSAGDTDETVVVTQSFTGKGGTGTYLLSKLQDVSSSMKSTTITATNRYWGVLVPYHNGNRGIQGWFGKAVVIDLYKYAEDYENCIVDKNYRWEWKEGGEFKYRG